MLQTVPSSSLALPPVIFTPGERRVFRRREKLTVSQWAERHRVITNGPITGKWRNDVTPYLTEPMDCWNLPWVREIILCFAPQTGKTQVGFNCLCYAIDQDPGPAMYIMPDEKVAKRIARRRILPMFTGSPRIAALMSPRNDDTTIAAVRFINGMDLMMAWATSAAELASESVRYVIFDEEDKFPGFAGQEADPIGLGRVRTNTYPHTKKILHMSTPTTSEGHITKALENEADEVREYEACCPVCGEHQIMKFDSIIFPEKVREPREIARRKLASYQCTACGMFWDDHLRDQAVRTGRWISPKPCADGRPAVIGFHLPSWYSPFVSLSNVAADFLRGQQGDHGKLMFFVTQHKAEAWKQVVIQIEESKILQARCDLPAQTVPDTAVALTCGIDVQKAGFWFVVRAWASDGTSWLIHYGYLPTWADVEHLLFETEYPQQDRSRTHRIWRAAIDTGGGRKDDDTSMTDETYFWLVRNSLGRGVAIWGTKGSSHAIPGRFKKGEALLKTRSGKKLPDWFHIVLIDTDAMKDSYHYGIEQAISAGPNALYLHRETANDYARQIQAEQKQKHPKTGAVEWVRVKKDNHLLDAELLSISVAQPQWIGGGVNLLGGRRPVNQVEAGKRENKTTPRVIKSSWMGR